MTMTMTMTMTLTLTLTMTMAVSERERDEPERPGATWRRDMRCRRLFRSERGAGPPTASHSGPVSQFRVVTLTIR